MGGYIQDRLSPEPLNTYNQVVKWSMLRLMLILQCIIIFQSQNIDFTNAFDQVDILRGEQVSIEVPRHFNSDGGNYDVVVRSKKILYGNTKPHAYAVKN